jgi:type I restriction enzyme, S subunit
MGSTPSAALLKAAVTGERTKDWREANTRAGKPPGKTGHDLLVRVKSERDANAPAKGRGRRAADPTPLNVSALPDPPEG